MVPETGVKAQIRIQIEEAARILQELNHVLEPVSVDEFYDYLTGETFTGDKTTLQDILENQYYVLHEVVEISELKKNGVKINTTTVINAPRDLIYIAHFDATEIELGYALEEKDIEWLKLRLGHHYNVLTDDPWMPESMKPRAQAIWDKYKKYQ